MPLYEEIYGKRNRGYFEALEKQAEEMARKHGCRFVDNETPYERVQQGHPTIVDYFYHEEVKGTANSGIRNLKQIAWIDNDELETVLIERMKIEGCRIYDNIKDAYADV